MRIEDHRRQDEAKARRESGVNTPTNGAPGTMQLNGTEYVAVTPANTQRGGPLHPSLPTRPGFDIVPKEEVASKGKKMSASQREAASLNAGKNALLEAQGSNLDVVANRKKIRMANLSAAQLLKAELAGEDESKEDTVEVEVEGEEKEEMKVDDLKAIKDEEAEDEGVDEEIIPPVVAVEESEEQEMPVDESVAGDNKPARGTKRKADEREGDEDGSAEDGSDVEDPPNPEADQPISKKKLKINPDGTVDGYVDDVR